MRPQDEPLLGQAIGPYRITKLLGAGGMGRVYKAVQPSIGARVAVKVLSQECASNQELIERFFAEARSVNLIRHEQIVNVIDLAQLPDGRPYIIMEYLDGAPLSGVIAKRGQLPLGTMAQLMVEVLDALGAAHARNIIHRDLKPDNIFVSPAGHAKVLDFGIAKLDPGLQGSNASTRAGSILGTPPYMSPEQAMARPIDARADIYSMGIILYEATTGRVPFMAESLFEILRMHMEVPPALPRTLRPDVTPAIEAVILRAIEKDPARRFQSTHDMATALMQAAQGLPPEAWQTLRTTEGIVALPGQITPFASRPGGISFASTQATAKGSRVGLVLGLLGAVAVAGGITTAIILSRGEKDVPARGDATREPGTKDPTKDPLTATKVAGDPNTGKDSGKEPSKDPGKDASKAPVTAGGEAKSPVATAVHLPPELYSGIAACDAFLLNYYACVSTKMPEAYRAQMLDGLKQMAQGFKQAGNTGGGSDVEKAMTDSCNQASDATKKGMAAYGCTWDLVPEGAPATQPKSNTPEHSEPAPSNAPKAIDAKNFDAIGYLPEAVRLAEKSVAAPELTRIILFNVKPDGFVDLTIGGYPFVQYAFRSKPASERGSTPQGVELPCLVNVFVTSYQGIRTEPRTDEKCEDKIIGPPKCTPGAIWKKALAKGAPENAIASLQWMTDFDGDTHWMFSIGKDGDHFMTFKDDCAAP